MNSNTDLLLLNFDIGSIGSNFDTFNCFKNVLNKKIHIQSFSESQLNVNNKKPILYIQSIAGYDALPNVRCDGHCGGGLSVYISNVLNPKYSSKLVPCPCTISLNSNHLTLRENYKFFVVSIYRLPTTNSILFINKLAELISIISGNGYDEIVQCAWRFPILIF